MASATGHAIGSIVPCGRAKKLPRAVWQALSSLDAATARTMLSIVIPTHNRMDLLRACLAAALRHAPAGTEVTVVDDGSPNQEASETAGRFDGVRVLRLPRRRGFCAAANLGIHASHGDVIELLNDDTEVQERWAAPALDWFADPTVAAVAPLVVTGRNGALVDSAGDRYYVGGVAGKRGHAEPLALPYLSSRPVFGASASSAFYRRSALHQVGAFPESFGAYFEDVDLAFRLQRAGYRAIFEPASRVFHHVSASHGRRRRVLLEQQSHNEEQVFWRNLPARTLLRALPCHLAVLAGKARRRWRDGTLLPFICGRLRLLGNVSDLLRHRRQLARIGPDVPVERWHVEAEFWGSRI
jgi:GT2 family glycosyltransferase